MKRCENIRVHLSALLDGALEPLESIAVRRHVDRCDACRRELAELERLKVQVHVAGTETRLPELLDARLRAGIRAQADRRRARTSGTRWLPAAAAAAVIVGLVLTSVSGEDARRESAVMVTKAQQEVVLSQDALKRLVAVHHGRATPRLLDDMVQAGALMAYEQLPDSFIGADGQKAALVQASYADCDGSQYGSSLAVFKAGQVAMPPAVVSALETSGVYVDVIDGVEIRLTMGREKVFVLLSEVGPVAPGSAI